MPIPILRPTRCSSVKPRAWRNLALAGVLIGPVMALHAGEFTNLGFDEPELGNRVDVSDRAPWVWYTSPPLNVYVGTVKDFFPGWRVIDNVTHAEVTEAYQLSDSFKDYSEYLGLSPVLVPGDAGYAAEICPAGSMPFPGGSSLLQTGEVPADAMKLAFRLRYEWFELRVNDQIVPTRFATQWDQISYGIMADAHLEADVSQFAGQTVELKFTCTPTFSPDGNFHNHSVIDDIAFVVPEPSAWAMLVVGFAAIGFSRIRRYSA